MKQSYTINVAIQQQPSARATIALGGTIYQFDPARGAVEDNYRDPAGEFVQRNILCVHPAMPAFRAYYRPDASSDREEWIFELGDRVVAAANLPGYSVEITRANGERVIIQVPQHFWFGRWRWQSAPRPVRSTVADLISDDLIPNYTGTAELTRFSADKGAQSYVPMGMAGVYANMGHTGERPDIGIITGQQGDYVCVGRNLATVMAQAEASGTINMHVRDAGRAPMDLFASPKASMYSAQVGAPFIPRTSCLPADSGGMSLNYDTGHQPALTYLPFLLTGDPYYLEEVQFEANMDVLVCPPASRWRQNGRYLAWSLRNCLYAAAVTPSAVPSWLQPRAYFQRHLDQYKSFVDSVIAKGDPLHLIASGGSQATPGFPAGSYCSPWQEDFLTAVFAIAIRLGFNEWRPAFLWKLDCTVQRTNGTVWPLSNPTPYNMSMMYGCALAAPCTATDTKITVDAAGGGPWPAVPFAAKIQSELVTVLDVSSHPVWTVNRPKPVAHPIGHGVYGPTFASWSECAVRNVAAHPEIFQTTDGPGQLSSKPSTYPSYCRGALALAVSLAADEAEAPFTWLDSELRRLTSRTFQTDRKWAFSP